MTPNSRDVFILLFIIGGIFADGLMELNPIVDPETYAGKFEGDMIFSVEQMMALTNPILGRSGLLDVTKRWPNRTVLYKLTGDFSSVHRDAIMAAMETIRLRTCLKFLVADDLAPYFVQITAKPEGCYSAVGYQKRVQEMNLQIFPIGEGCFRPGTILHELMHVLGFYHQQGAADRDDYIEVIYENIVPGKEFNFKKYPDTIVTDFGVGYDYGSCTHYRPGAFSKNGLDTIVPLDPEAVIGQRLGLSTKDIDKINLMYKCPIKI